jgi:hypothetical protein
VKQRFSYINYFRFSLSVVRLAFLLFLMSVKPVQSQQVDSIGADSARIKVLERLEVLARPPGIDSTLFVADSLLSSSRPIEVGSSFSPDSFLNQLLTLPEYSIVRYSGQQALFDALNEKLTLSGTENSPAELHQDGMSVIAIDTINLTDSLLWTTGETLTERLGQEPVQSNGVIYDGGKEQGSAFAAKTSLSEGATWIMSGDLPAILPDTVFGHDVMFTSCEETEPHYHFSAGELKAVGGNWLLARNVTLNFADVPVLWLPFIFQNTETGRHSGILTPRFGVNDIVRSSRGQSRRVSNIGYFWAINEYTDATVSGDWWSDNFTSLTGNFRYRINKKFLDGSTSVRQYWRNSGGSELSYDTRHSWQLDERSMFKFSARYASSSQFVRENSFDPREVTQSINSEGGFNRRFNWGNLSLTANRRQFLSDDRVEMTLPTANVSLKSVTLFKAPANQARFYSNLTWSGSGRYTRSLIDRPTQVGQVFMDNSADQARTVGEVSSAFNLGALSWGQSLMFNEKIIRETPLMQSEIQSQEDSTSSTVFDKATADLNWNSSLGYQQRLIGTTTLTPSLQVSGALKRSNGDSAMQNFIAGPKRLSFGARLKGDIYGYFGGLMGFEAVRHKISPSLSYSYAPQILSSDLQKTVFGVYEGDARNVITLGFNQTFEAKRNEIREEDDPDDSRAPDGSPSASDSINARADTSSGPSRPPASRVVNLLGISTSMLNYDFVRANDTDSGLMGFTTTRIQNQLSSDLLRGLQISMEHDLFTNSDEGVRSFDPDLSQLNLSFSMNSNSGVIQSIYSFLGVTTGTEPSSKGAPESNSEEDFDPLNLLQDGTSNTNPTDESSVIPGAGPTDINAGEGPDNNANRQGPSWETNFAYSLRRSRHLNHVGSQLLQVGLRLKPTEEWDLTWRTAYDIDLGSFTDHSIRLARNLHRWEAHFDFVQTVTGNWSFRFEVALTDNRDLKFDYDQRSTDFSGRY